jgi:GTPase SAR1 family protein
VEYFEEITSNHFRNLLQNAFRTWRGQDVAPTSCLKSSGLHSLHLNPIMPPRYGQLVIGPPGSGKSTYCDGIHQFLSAVGRPCSVVNLDPANDSTSYKPALDVRKLVSLEEIMKEEQLGPNGGVLHALEALEQDFDWLKDGLDGLDGA